MAVDKRSIWQIVCVRFFTSQSTHEAEYVHLSVHSQMNKKELISISLLFFTSLSNAYFQINWTPIRSAAGFSRKPQQQQHLQQHTNVILLKMCTTKISSHNKNDEIKEMKNTNTRCETVNEQYKERTNEQKKKTNLDIHIMNVYNIVYSVCTKINIEKRIKRKKNYVRTKNICSIYTPNVWYVWYTHWEHWKTHTECVPEKL